MTSGSIPSMSVGDHSNMFEFSDKNCLNNVFSYESRFEPIRRVCFGQCKPTLKDSGSSILLSGFPDSVGESGY